MLTIQEPGEIGFDNEVVDGRIPIEAVQIIFSKMKGIIILTKKDLVNEEELKLKIDKFKDKEVIPVSINDKKSLDKLINVILTT